MTESKKKYSQKIDPSCLLTNAACPNGEVMILEMEEWDFLMNYRRFPEEGQKEIEKELVRIAKKYDKNDCD